MAFCDFVVKYNPETDTPLVIAERILYSIFVKRLKAHKPCVIFMSGGSGEGKSISTLAFEDIILRIQNVDLKQYVNDVNVYTPLEYPKKLKRLLFEKELKKVNIIAIHEAREVVKAKLWHSFLNQSISDINAMSRAVKRMITIVVSQSIRDISTDIRFTLNYYCIVRRPKRQPARVKIKVLWLDDSDLEKPKLKARNISGYLVYPDGSYQHYCPPYIEIKPPDKVIVDEFEKNDFESKSNILKGKIDKLIKVMEKDMNVENKKVDTMADWYADHPESLYLIGKYVRNKFRLKKEFKSMHDMSDHDTDIFEIKLNDRMKKKGFVGEESFNKEIEGGESFPQTVSDLNDGNEEI